MITRGQYDKAIELREECNMIVREYESIENINKHEAKVEFMSQFNRNDMIECIDESYTKVLTRGKKYRMTGPPVFDPYCIYWYIPVINDNGKRMRAYDVNFFNLNNESRS
jgi:hypothetical protein